jgi:hypothetical protein
MLRARVRLVAAGLIERVRSDEEAAAGAYVRPA